MVAPYRHVGVYGELTDDEVLEIHRLAAQGIDALGELYAPDGHNLGWNLGRVAGAGVVDHVHLHVVPRWEGDTNFMPVLADVKVMPEHLAETRRRLAAAWPAADACNRGRFARLCSAWGSSPEGSAVAGATGRPTACRPAST